jgi:L-ascorbate metabolism protein UlaG (beta-lactamase superfamily)
MKIYKIYNEGFIARTQSVTIAFDIVRGACAGKTLISEALIRQVVNYCDVLFITHSHGDHADPVVAEMFIKAGKPVIATTDFQAGAKGIQHIRSENVINKEMILGNNKKIQVKIYPGHQGELMNNIYVATTEEKKSIAHIGDQYNEEDMDWIVNLKKLLSSIWQAFLLFRPFVTQYPVLLSIYLCKSPRNSGIGKVCTEFRRETYSYSITF